MAIPAFSASAQTSEPAAAAESQYGRLDPWFLGYERPFRSMITEATVREISSRMSISESQEQALAHTLNRHRERFAAFVAENRPVFNEWNRKALEHSDSTKLPWLEVRIDREEALAPIADRQRELDEQFWTDVATIFAESQHEEFERARRAIYRTHRIRSAYSMFIEETLDLVALIESAIEDDEHPIWDDEDFQAVLYAYETELDDVLRRRDDTLIPLARHEFRRRADRMKTDGDSVWEVPAHPDEGKYWQARRTRVRSHEAVRDVNRRYLTIFESILPEAAAARLKAEYHRHVLARVGLTREAETLARFVDDVLALDDLTNDQREVIEAAQLLYEQRAPAAVQEIVRTNTRQREMFKSWPEMNEQLAIEKSHNDAIDRWLRLGRELLASIRPALTPEQIEALPESPTLEANQDS